MIAGLWYIIICLLSLISDYMLDQIVYGHFK